MGPFLVSRYLLFREDGLVVGGQRAVVESRLGRPDVVCNWRGTGDPGLFAPHSSCPGSSRSQGSHLPCASVVLLR